jgi:demethylmenaquinone methyltransferase/2-methoxy-6-polyprenyl-1,4-benzoquinol methylase
LAFALAAESRRVGRSGGARITGADFAHPMLVRACEKARTADGQPSVVFLEADALNLPFADQSFDLVTTAFGFRNLANYAAGLAEIHRVLRPGGHIAILEFAEPEGPIFGPIYRFYFHNVLPSLGGLVSGSGQAYGYLPSSVARFPRPPELAKLMERCDFGAAKFERWTGGIVALHTAKR